MDKNYKKYKRVKHSLQLKKSVRAGECACGCDCGTHDNNSVHLKKEETNSSLNFECGCSHCAEKAIKKQNKINKSNLISVFKIEILRLVLCAVLIVSAFLVKNNVASTILFALSALTCGYDLVINCFKNIIKGNFFDENTLMLVASVTAFCLKESFEGALIVFLFNLGEMLEGMATANSRKKIAGLSELKSTIAHLITDKGIVDVSPENLDVGSLIEVKAGERVPVDGVLISSAVELDMKSITGESAYYLVETGGEVYSGAVNVGNPFVVRTTTCYKDSTIERIISMVEGSASKKAKSQKFISTFAKIYTPIITLVAILIATIPPLFDSLEFSKWIYKALSFLVVSCPCALVISVPLAFFTGIGSLARKGILVKGSNVMENITKLKAIVFDKTGTITKGNFTVENFQVFDDYNYKEVVEMVVSLEYNSNHPISKSIVERYRSNTIKQALNVKEIAGQGISGTIDGKNVYIGNAKLMNNIGVKVSNVDFVGTVLFVVIDGILVGMIYVSDQIKDGARECIYNLRRLGVRHAAMISGDREEIVKNVSSYVDLDEFYFEKLPNEKLDCFNNIQTRFENKVAYVGDGVNDTPALSAAYVGISMGGLGSEAAVECSDVVLMDDDITKIPKAIKHAKKVKATVISNIALSLTVKFVIMILSVFTFIPIWIAMFGDVGVMLLAVVNSLVNARCR